METPIVTPGGNRKTRCTPLSLPFHRNTGC